MAGFYPDTLGLGEQLALGEYAGDLEAVPTADPGQNLMVLALGQSPPPDPESALLFY